MQRVYILRDDEGDGFFADDLTEIIDLEQMENPQCPRCGAGTLLAYTEDDEYDVLIWFCLTDEDDAARPDAWYLICRNFTCGYEEQVERVSSPAGAVLFDLVQSHDELDDETGLISRHPASMKKLIAYLERLKTIYAYRKLNVFLEEAQWRYEEQLKRRRTWIKQIPEGRTIGIQLNDGWVKGTIITDSEEAVLVRTVPEGEVVGVNLEEVVDFRQSDTDLKQTMLSQIEWDSLVTIFPPQEYVVVNGHPLRIEYVDRLGQYSVSTPDPQAAAALGFAEQAEGYWTGYVRRNQVEARYDVRTLVKVKGHWVEMIGRTQSHCPDVTTEDAAVAAALGLTLVKPIWLGDEDPPKRVDRWTGIIPLDQVEESEEVRIYLWPIPELK